MSTHTRRHSHRYHGHRSSSFTPVDVPLLVEIRARQRTFNGAYARTALTNLSYSLLILKLFNKRFFLFGVLFGVLALGLVGLSWMRARHSRHDFSDAYRDDDDSSDDDDGRSRSGRSTQSDRNPGMRVFGRKFLTAGWIVVMVSATVALVEIGLLVLIFNLPL